MGQEIVGKTYKVTGAIGQYDPRANALAQLLALQGIRPSKYLKSKLLFVPPQFVEKLEEWSENKKRPAGPDLHIQGEDYWRERTADESRGSDASAEGDRSPDLCALASEWWSS